MKYITNEILIDDSGKKNAGSKARNDVTDIFVENEYEKLDLEWPILKKRSIFNLLKLQVKAKKEFINKFSCLKKGDVLVLQYPNMRWLFSIGTLINNLNRRGVKVVTWIHDIPSLRSELGSDSNSFLVHKLKMMEDQCFQASEKVISHNEKMTNYLIERNVDKEKIIDLNLFDYLYDKVPNVMPEGNSSLIVAGNLSREKAGYLEKIPNKLFMNLYGVGFSGKTDEYIKYYGSFFPEELIENLVGDYGLVWDGNSANGCKGSFGEYMKYNNPHKISLYLASGIPVVIWKQAALAEFVLNNKLGIVVDSLDELPSIFKNLTDEDYKIMKTNAESIGIKLRNGYFTKKVIKEMDL